MAAAFSVLIICFAVFEAANSHHDCSGEGCAVCAAMEVCEQLLSAGAAALASTSAALTVIACIVTVKAVKADKHRTLFQMKVMLLN